MGAIARRADRSRAGAGAGCGDDRCPTLGRHRAPGRARGPRSGRAARAAARTPRHSRPQHCSGARLLSRRERGRRRGRARRPRGRRRRAARALHARDRRGHAGVVRPQSARADPPLHDHAASGRDRAGLRGGLHALPVHLAASSSRAPRRRPRGAGRRGRAIGRVRGVGGRVGSRCAGGKVRRVRPGAARHLVPHRAGRVGPAEQPADGAAGWWRGSTRRSAGRPSDRGPDSRHAHRPLHAGARSTVAA